VSTTYDRAKILQIGRFIRFPSKFAKVWFLPTKERSFLQKSDKLFLCRGFKTNVKRAEQKKINLFFAPEFP